MKINLSGSGNQLCFRVFTLAFLLLVIPVSVSAISVSNQVERTITGQVTSEDFPDGLPGVNILVKGTGRGTITNSDGFYSIKVSGDKDVLVFSFVGFVTREIVVGSRIQIDVQLLIDSGDIEELVVVGYGTQKKETVTGSIVTVKTEELIQSPAANISNSLGGRLPGLTAVQTTGVPGEDMATLRIRGIGTLNPGSESAPLILVDGIEQSSINQLDPNEVASISILKDASATAVYGVRGANGVILVTTKSGSIGRPSINVTSNLAISKPTIIPNWLDSYNYAILRNEALVNDGYQPFFTDEEIQIFKDGSDPIFYPTEDQYTDFVDNPAFQQSYNVNMSGGSERVVYFVSTGFFDQYSSYALPKLDEDIGFDPRPGYTRNNLRTNIELKLTDNLTAKIKMGGYFDHKHNANTTSVNNPNPNKEILDSFTGKPPMTGIGIYDGKLISGYRNDPLQKGDISRGYSIYQKIYSDGYRDSYSNNFTINLELDYNLGRIITGLKARGKVAYTHFYSTEIRRSKDVNSYSFVYDPEGDPFMIQTGFDSNFGYSASYDMNRRYYLEGGLEYLRKFGNHEVTGLVLYNQSKEHDPGLQYNVPTGYMGIVGRVTYNYMFRYMAEFNVGYNGSENFAKGNRFGFFPAVSLGWVLTEEPFFPENRILTYVKIRGSYGEVGNDKLGGDRFLYLPPIYEFPATNWLDNGYYFGKEGQNLQYLEGASEGAVGNPDITWEVAQKTNLGVDLRLFKDLAFHLDLFREKRDNILWEVTIVPGIIGSDLVPGNIGKVDNKGFEFETEWTKRLGEVRIVLGANYSFARNKIIYKAEPDHKYPWLNETGFSVDQMKGYRNEGFYNEPEELVNRPYINFGGNFVQRGDLKAVDIDGDGIIDPDDIVPTGFSEYPEKFFGLSGSLNYKNFDFYFLFQGAGNYYTELSGRSAWAFSNGMTATLSRMMNRWNLERYEAGLEISEPRVMEDGGSGINIGDNGFYLKDITYLRLKNIELGYTIYSQKLKSIGIQKFRMYLNGLNLLTWCRYQEMDPESPEASTYPIMATFNFGLSLNF